MVDLVNELRPQPTHWFNVFEGRIPQNVLAYQCRVSPGRFNQMLRGFLPMPRYVEDRLAEIERALEKPSNRKAGREARQ